MCTNAVAEEETQSVQDRLIAEYQQYVSSIVGTMVKSMGLPLQFFDEFVAAGYLGLVEAASRFDPKSGKDFKSFAYLRIRGSIIDSIRECADTSGKAYRYVKAMQSSHNLREDMYDSGASQSAASREEALAEVFDFAAKGILAFRLSVDDAEEELFNELGSPITPEEFLRGTQGNKKLRAAIATLPEKERLIIEEFYFNDRSFTEIADGPHGLSKSWVSRLHTKAIERLQTLLREEGGESACANHPGAADRLPRTDPA
ncbi:MAG: sigma-70 family RNA polymerase sigma factor [Proteobacteria bacterium]|nr:sigma-70 family RNA polymerase sigma factor [Pseudomonadota bacterium]